MAEQLQIRSRLQMTSFQFDNSVLFWRTGLYGIGTGWRGAPAMVPFLKVVVFVVKQLVGR